jgi:hypothetical protein
MSKDRDDIWEATATYRKFLLSDLIATVTGIPEEDARHSFLLDASLSSLQHHNFPDTNPKDVHQQLDSIYQILLEHAQIDKQQLLQGLIDHFLSVCEIPSTQVEISHRLLALSLGCAHTPLTTGIPTHSQNNIVRQLLAHQGAGKRRRGEDNQDEEDASSENSWAQEAPVPDNDDDDNLSASELDDQLDARQQQEQYKDVDKQRRQLNMPPPSTPQCEDAIADHIRRLRDNARTTASAAAASHYTTNSTHHNQGAKKTATGGKLYTKSSLSVWLAYKQSNGQPQKTLEPSLCFTEQGLLSQILHMLQGINCPGPAFMLDTSRNSYQSKKGVHIHYSSPQSTASLLEWFTNMGTRLRQVKAFVSSVVVPEKTAGDALWREKEGEGEEEGRDVMRFTDSTRWKKLPTIGAFAAALNGQLLAIDQQILSWTAQNSTGEGGEGESSSPPQLTLLLLKKELTPLQRHISALHSLSKHTCCRNSPAETAAGLLTALHTATECHMQMAGSMGGGLAAVHLSLFLASIRPYLTTLHTWLAVGRLDDPYKEFFIIHKQREIKDNKDNDENDYDMFAVAVGGDGVTPAAPSFLLPDLASTIMSTGQAAAMLHKHASVLTNPSRQTVADALAAVAADIIAPPLNIRRHVLNGNNNDDHDDISPTKKRLRDLGALGFDIAHRTQQQLPWGSPTKQLPVLQDEHEQQIVGCKTPSPEASSLSETTLHSSRSPTTPTSPPFLNQQGVGGGNRTAERDTIATMIKNYQTHQHPQELQVLMRQPIYTQLMINLKDMLTVQFTAESRTGQAMGRSSRTYVGNSDGGSSVISSASRSVNTMTPTSNTTTTTTHNTPSTTRSTLSSARPGLLPSREISATMFGDGGGGGEYHSERRSAHVLSPNKDLPALSPLVASDAVAGLGPNNSTAVAVVSNRRQTEEEREGEASLGERPSTTRTPCNDRLSIADRMKLAATNMSELSVASTSALHGHDILAAAAMCVIPGRGGESRRRTTSNSSGGGSGGGGGEGALERRRRRRKRTTSSSATSSLAGASHRSQEEQEEEEEALMNALRDANEAAAQFEGGQWGEWCKDVSATLSSRLLTPGRLLYGLGTAGGTDGSDSIMNNNNSINASSFSLEGALFRSFLPPFKGQNVADQIKMWGKAKKDGMPSLLLSRRVVNKDKEGKIDGGDTNNNVDDNMASDADDQDVAWLQDALADGDGPPMASIIHQCLRAPIQARADVIGQALTAAMLHQGLLMQFQALRDLSLLSPLVMEPFMKLLLQKISSPQGMNGVSQYELEAALQDAIDTADDGGGGGGKKKKEEEQQRQQATAAGKQYHHSLKRALKSLNPGVLVVEKSSYSSAAVGDDNNNSSNNNNIHALSRIKLTVNPTWPLSLLITEDLLNLHSELATFISQLRWVDMSMQSLRYSSWKDHTTTIPMNHRHSPMKKKKSITTTTSSSTSHHQEHYMFHLASASLRHVISRAAAAGIWLDNALMSLDEISLGTGVNGDGGGGTAMHMVRDAYCAAVRRYCLLGKESSSRLAKDALMKSLDAALQHCRLMSGLKRVKEQIDAVDAGLQQVGGLEEEEKEDKSDVEDEEEEEEGYVSDTKEEEEGELKQQQEQYGVALAELHRKKKMLEEDLHSIAVEFGNRHRLLLRVLRTKSEEAGGHVEEMRAFLAAIDFNSAL